MSSELQAFHAELVQSVMIGSSTEGRFAEDSFFEVFCAHLIEAGELETADRAHYVGPRGVRIDGYGGDPTQADGTLTLIIADFTQSHEIQTLTATEMDAIFNRATNFLKRCLDASFRSSLEETSAGFGLADLIAGTWSSVSKVRLLLISDRVLSTRVDGRPSGSIDDRPLLYNVWDLSRLERYVTSGRSREDLVVDLGEFGGSLAALPAHLDGADYEAYLVVLPGSTLAAIYDRWSARLLEQNVRVFLQARTGVNKGIRNTIDQNPEMFFAYNNGITATAEEVETRERGGSIQITKIRNLQIVNGGQTTASIHAASRRTASGATGGGAPQLARVFVQMKLAVIPQERAEEAVPKISEYANSQNKVSAADFFSNHPYHIRFKNFSEKIFAPSPDGGVINTKWFYERARGQYQDARAGLTVAERRKFDLEHPKKQVISKTDLAKFLGVWEGRPHIVSRGAQKAFADFAERIGKDWKDSENFYNELYFRTAIAKAIIFHEMEATVSKQHWYDGGYRAQIVAYSIAKLAFDVGKWAKSVDFERIWKNQAISVPLREALTVAARYVNEVITSPIEGVRNVTEWAKKDACWNRVEALAVAWPSAWRAELVSWESQKHAEKGAVKEQKVLNGIEAQTAVVEAGARVWRELKEWGETRKLLSQKEIDILSVAAALPQKVPTDKQAFVALAALKRLREEGFVPAEGMA